MQGRPMCHALPVMRVDFVSVPDINSSSEGGLLEGCPGVEPGAQAAARARRVHAEGMHSRYYRGKNC